MIFDAPSPDPRLLERLALRVAQEQRDGAHGLGHVLRVTHISFQLAREEGALELVCGTAALLHDLVYLPKNHPDSPRTAELSALEARDWCRDYAELAPHAEAVAEAVETHSFSGGKAPRSLEGAVLQDADRLDALGAIGIARVFATGGSMGAGMWDEADPWGLERELDDKRYSLDHFEKKLLKLAGGMNTQAGRREAQRRQERMLVFLEGLREELG
ncbi:HD domain-containing protein [Holophaga foetida]|uniref:HD domain-containing protein n=1 Tax=Holophaga foetida TaxID=35839 RepID=UPI0002472EC4|nr:HD domain-containing protein [Holophaga foetida]